MGTSTFWGAPLVQDQATFSSACDFMMGLGQPKLLAKFQIAGFICYGNIREFVLNDKFTFWATLWGVRDNVRPSSIARWKARGRLPIRDNWTFFASFYGYTIQYRFIEVWQPKAGLHVISRYWSKRFSEADGSLWAQILGGRGRLPPIIVGVRKLERFAISQWRSHDPTFIHLGRVPACNRQIDRQTDGRTDGIAVANTALCIGSNAAAL